MFYNNYYSLCMYNSSWKQDSWMTQHFDLLFFLCFVYTVLRLVDEMSCERSVWPCFAINPGKSYIHRFHIGKWRLAKIKNFHKSISRSLSQNTNVWKTMMEINCRKHPSYPSTPQSQCLAKPCSCRRKQQKDIR